MSRRHYDLPPLTTLAAFEAAARHLSFKSAAQELNVTPGAVSHQIKSLESATGCALFLRRHRGVELTEQGRKLSATLSESFRQIASELQLIRNFRADRAVVVGATSAVASLLLAPAVTRFWLQNGDIPINQIVSDHGFDHDMTVDMFVRYGRDSNAHLDQSVLFRDRLVPVGSGAVCRGVSDPTLKDLAEMRLIHLDSSDTSWTSWEEWFAALGFDGPIASGIRVNNYTIALQAARDGAGVALGWQRLIGPLTRTGDLVPIGTHVLESPQDFHVVSRPEADLSKNARQLRDWIVENIRHG